MNTEQLNESIIVYLAPNFGDTEPQFFSIVDLDLTSEEWFEALNGQGTYASLRNGISRSLSVGDALLFPDGQYSKVNPCGWSTGIWGTLDNFIFVDPVI